MQIMLTRILFTDSVHFSKKLIGEYKLFHLQLSLSFYHNEISARLESMGMPEPPCLS